LPDSIALSYEADRYNTVPTGAGITALPTDCVGSTLDTVTATVAINTTFSLADNRFYIGTSTVGSVVVPSLYCKGIESVEQPMVENVEDLQLAYGAVNSTTTSPTATVAGYRSASEIEPTGAADPAAWGRVLTVRVCVVVRSENPILSEGISQQYVKCDGTVDTTMTDRRLRRAYSTTVVLRNRRS
jgi:type IV pilus assembly protein PilW